MPNLGANGEITITGAQHLAPGMVISVQNGDGTQFVGRIERIDTHTSIAMVEEIPATWVRPGQTAYRRRAPADRVQITGITEVVNLRRWTTTDFTAEIGVRTTMSREEFEREFWPHYNSNQTSMGARFYRVRSQSFYEVFAEDSRTFSLRDPKNQHDVTLAREGEDPAEWLYVGTRPINGRTDFMPLTITRQMAVQAMPPEPASRFDRDDVV